MNSLRSAPLRRLVALAALSLFLLPATASAQSSVDGYAPDDGVVQNQIESGGDQPKSSDAPDTKAPAPERAGSSLPFTGLDLAMLVGAGVALVGVGAGMRFLLRLPPPVR
jgi:hypothetical protein